MVWLNISQDITRDQFIIMSTLELIEQAPTFYDLKYIFLNVKLFYEVIFFIEMWEIVMVEVKANGFKLNISHSENIENMACFIDCYNTAFITLLLLAIQEYFMQYFRHF